MKYNILFKAFNGPPEIGIGGSTMEREVAFA